jgi:hypothetical protein
VPKHRRAYRPHILRNSRLPGSLAPQVASSYRFNHDLGLIIIGQLQAANDINKVSRQAIFILIPLLLFLMNTYADSDKRTVMIYKQIRTPVINIKFDIIRLLRA